MREKHRPVDSRLDHCLGAELPRQGYGRLMLGRLALEERDYPGDDREREQDGDTGERELQAAVLPLAASQLELVRGAAGIDELALELREGDVRLIGQELELRQIAAAEKKAGIVVSVVPLPCGVRETAVKTDVFPRGVDPAA